MLKMTKEEISDYASVIDPDTFPYFCAVTGELEQNLRSVIRTTIVDLIRFRILHHWCKSGKR